MSQESLTQREKRAHLKRTNAQYGYSLVKVEVPTGVAIPPGQFSVFRSKDFLVQLFRVRDGVVRISVNRTDVKGSRWTDGIAWEDIQRIKRECGYGDCDAVEVYPRDRDQVNVANMRHLFVYESEEFELAWRNV